MVVDAEYKGARVFVEEKFSRIIRLGKMVRDTSLDELPQLITVFKGEMNLIGPWAIWPYQVERYDDRQRRRLLVKPGIKG